MLRYSLKSMARRKGIKRRVVIRPPMLRRAFEHDLDQIARDLVLAPFRQYRSELLAQAASERPQMIKDDLSDVIWLIGQAYGLLREQARSMIRRTLSLEAARHTADWRERVNKAIGIDLSAVVDDEDIRPHIELAAQGFMVLIKGLTDEIQKRLASKLIPMIIAGASQRQMAEMLAGEFDFSKKRAALIGRDQAAKFNGALNRIRQQQAGVTTYQWSTSLDERVRGNPSGKYPNAKPSHWDREGKEFSWSKPPSDGHPGEPINCRCVALAVLN